VSDSYQLDSIHFTRYSKLIYSVYRLSRADHPDNALPIMVGNGFGSPNWIYKTAGGVSIFFITLSLYHLALDEPSVRLYKISATSQPELFPGGTYFLKYAILALGFRLKIINFENGHSTSYR
jgi:hypothetical protein